MDSDGNDHNKEIKYNTDKARQRPCRDMHYCEAVCNRLNTFIKETFGEPEKNRAVCLLYLLSIGSLFMGMTMLLVSVVDSAVRVLPRDPLTMLAIVHLGVAFTLALVATQIRKPSTHTHGDGRKCWTEKNDGEETCPSVFQAEDDSDKKQN